MADQTQRLEIATVRAEVGSNIVYRFANDAAAATPIPTESGDIPNLKQIILDIQLDATEKISISTTIYPTVSAGLAATSDQEIFLVQSDDANEIYTVWKNNAGSAVNTGKSAMSSEAIQQALQASNEAAQAAEDAADVATNRTAGFLSPSLVDPVVRDNGLPLEQGDRYFNTADQLEKIYTASGWAANDSIEAIESIRNSSDPEKGGREVGYDGANVSDMLDLARPFAAYASLRNYAGFAKVAEIKESGVAGLFLRDDADSTSSDDGGTVIIDALSRRWKRSISGRVSVRWFGAPSSTIDQLSAFTAASAAASRRASGLAGDVDVPPGNWLISQSIPQAANWYLDGAATILGQPTVGSETVPIHDTSYLTGRITDFRAGSAAQLRIGDPNPWLTKEYRPISECIATASFINDRGRPALLAATRTSGNSGGSALGYAASFTVVNDKVDSTVGGWSGYTETYRIGDAGNTLGHEFDFINTGNTIDLGPYTNLNTGITVNNWLVCGGGSTPLSSLSQNISAHIAMAPNQKGANRGIVVRNGSISGAEREVLAVPDAHKLAWYASDNVRLSYLDDVAHNRLSRSAVVTECALDVSRRRNGSAAVATSNGTKAYRHEQQAFNGTSYMLAGYQELVQQTDFAGGTARFAYTIAAHNIDGTTAAWSLNKIGGYALGPDNDAQSNFAGPSNRVNNSFFAVAPTVTSDERDKEQIKEIEEAILDAWAIVNYSQYKKKDAVVTKGPGARWHFGLIAQRVESVFAEAGLDARELGLLCHDSWEAQYEEVPAEYEIIEPVLSNILGSDGKPIVIVEASKREVTPAYQREVLKAGERYGIRYEEALSLEAALMRRTTKRLEIRLANLEARSR
ncbi:tail fiber domain-containing protein [Pseudomonas sp. Eb3]|uniref:tail fiber domain-containing protein n=2 Tax=unclassified Pseudomonas TaxID=196821 RepID=UPI00210480D7|nr:tail fiber domain-containing protein [Pseudomonas sp. Eb3]MCQ1989636.1 tail fiber domain-containing protein [Pseudomonas sp. Eb3]